MCFMSYILIVGILGLSSYAVGTLPDYVSEDANVGAPVNTRNSRNCGNGRLDPGEECDCGPGAEKCSNDPCCHPHCQLKLHSQCSDNDPCCEHCKFKPQGSICHHATHECGIPEYCTGSKSECPASSHKRNGANCTGDYGRGICVSGVCKSFDQPCHEAWKSSETEPVRELTKCSHGMICINQTCHPIRDLVNGNGCPRGHSGPAPGSPRLECSGHGDCTTNYVCHCSPGWKGYDCSEKIDFNISAIDTERPGKIKGLGPEQRDSTSNTTALVGGLVSFVIVVSVMFVIMAIRYLPTRTPKDDSGVYPPPIQSSSMNQSEPNNTTINNLSGTSATIISAGDGPTPPLTIVSK